MRKLMLLVLLGVIAAFSGTVNAGLGDGLVAYWPFDDNADDSVGDNNGTLVGGASYVDGKIGKAVATSNDNTQDYVAFDTTSDGLTGAWTAAAWIYVHSGAEVGGFIDGYFGDEADDDCYGLRLPGQYQATSNPGMTDYVSNTNAEWGGIESQTQAYATPLGTWTLMVFAGNDTQCELFADGVSQGTVVYTEVDPEMQFKLTWDWLGNIRKYPTFGSAVVDYDELAIWDRTLTYEEIQYLWNSGEGIQFVIQQYSPGDGDMLAAAESSALELSWTNLPPISDSTVVDLWWGTEPNELSGDYDMAKLVDAEAVESYVSVDSSVGDTYYWRVDSYRRGPGHVNEPNRLEGITWSYTTVSDPAPEIVSVTPAQMTWSGEGAPLVATITNEGASATVIEWTADDDSLADPNFTIEIINADQADPTVTITKTGPTDDVVTVTMTVTVSDGANPAPVEASVEIDVYNDACHMARVAEGKSAIADFNNNCVTGLEDLAVVAADWLDDYSSTGPTDRL